MLAWSVLNNVATTFRPPEQLLPLPAMPRAIRGYGSGYLHQAHPYIETVDGETYRYEWERGVSGGLAASTVVHTLARLVLMIGQN
jgi:hypothetical protein